MCRAEHPKIRLPRHLRTKLIVVVGEKVNLVIPFQVCSGGRLWRPRQHGYAEKEPHQLRLDLQATSEAKAKQTKENSRAALAEEAEETSNIAGN